MPIDEPSGPAETELYNPPPEFYAAYVKWYEDTLKVLLSICVGKKAREHLLSFYKPESEPDIVQRMRGLPQQNRDETVRLCLAGYEAVRKEKSVRQERVAAMTRTIVCSLLNTDDRSEGIRAK